MGGSGRCPRSQLMLINLVMDFHVPAPRSRSRFSPTLSSSAPPAYSPLPGPPPLPLLPSPSLLPCKLGFQTPQLPRPVSSFPSKSSFVLSPVSECLSSSRPDLHHSLKVWLMSPPPYIKFYFIPHGPSPFCPSSGSSGEDHAVVPALSSANTSFSRRRPHLPLHPCPALPPMPD